MEKNKININCYFITNGITCNDLVKLINNKNLLSKVGITGIKYNNNSFLSDIGLTQTKILLNNKIIKEIIEETDFVGTSMLNSSIENSLILYKNTNITIYPLPFLSENNNNIKKIYQKNKNKNINELFDNKNFEINMDENNNKNKKINRKKNYDKKLNDINYSLIDNIKKIKININQDVNKFMKIIYPKIIKKLLKNKKREYNLVFFVDIKFIYNLIIKYKKLNKETIENIKHNGVIKINYEYDIVLNKNTYKNNEIIFPTYLNHNGYKIIDDEYYYEYKNMSYPLKYAKIEDKYIIEDLFKRCENYKKIIKHIKK